jgi:hypothetical protein
MAAKRYIETHGKSKLSNADLAAYLYEGKSLPKEK